MKPLRVISATTKGLNQGFLFIFYLTAILKTTKKRQIKRIFSIFVLYFYFLSIAYYSERHLAPITDVRDREPNAYLFLFGIQFCQMCLFCPEEIVRKYFTKAASGTDVIVHWAVIDTGLLKFAKFGVEVNKWYPYKKFLDNSLSYGVQLSSRLSLYRVLLEFFRSRFQCYSKVKFLNK